MRISDWSSDVCSSDLQHRGAGTQHRAIAAAAAARAGAEEAAPGPLSIGAIGPAHFEKPDTGLEQRLATLRIARMDDPHIGSLKGIGENGHVDAARSQRPQSIDPGTRSEETTSEIQSLLSNTYAVLC